MASVLIAATPPAIGSGHVLKAPTPTWVDTLRIPAPRAERLRQVQDGEYNLLWDTQIRADGGLESFYRRCVVQVTDREGLEDSARVEIQFDPDSEDVVFHHIRVWRDGVATDYLRAVHIDILRRESDLDNGIMDGEKTAHLEIPGVRVGDIVDYDYSLERHSRLFPGQIFHDMTTNWSVPMEFQRLRVEVPSARPLTIVNRNTGLKPSRAHDGAWTIYEWKVTDPEPAAADKDMPDWFSLWGHVYVSSMASWGELSAKALTFYADKDLLPAALADRADRIEARYKDPSDRITQALRLVQDDLRYVSVSIGINSFVPHTPAQVVADGYGDCKDKSQLLVALLRHMGIEAYPALTDTEHGRTLHERAPSPNIFDHVIVQVRLNGHAYWLDPTRTLQGGRFPDLAPLDYGEALPLAPGQDRLETIAVPPEKSPTEVSTEHYTMAADGSLDLTVATRYRDDDADWMRSNIASKSPAQIEREYLDYYAGLYPGLQIAKRIRFSDDRDDNTLLTYEAYILPARQLAKGNLRTKFIVQASSLNDYDDPPSGPRNSPYALPLTVNKRHIIILDTPAHEPPAPYPVTISNPLFRYVMAVARRGDRLTFDYSLLGKKNVVWPAAMQAFARDASSVKDDNYWYLDLTSAEGGHIGSQQFQWTHELIRLLLLSLLMAIGIYGLVKGVQEDDGRAADGCFYPVTIRKFVLMSFATCGSYGFFWVWKCWRWSKQHQPEQRHILPIWRALFDILWLWPLFSTIDKCSRNGRVSVWLGAAAAVAYPSLYVTYMFLTFTLHPPKAIPLAAGYILSLCHLPALVAVLRLNKENSKLVHTNSRWSGLTLAAIAWSVCYYGLYLIPDAWL